MHCEEGTALGNADQKAKGLVSNSPGPCTCTLFLFPARLVYFHKGVIWRVWGSSEKNCPARYRST